MKDTRPSASVGSHRTSAPLAAAALAVLLAGCGGGQPSGSAEAGRTPSGATRDAIAVRVAEAVRAPISALYSTSATLRADKRATVIARTRGVVRRLMVEEGDRVAADAPLAELENEEQRIAAERARATAETRQREYERLRTLREQQLVSEEEYEQARREATDASHALELAELELSRTVIRAPFAGIVLRRHLDVGATVADGTAVYDLADVDPLYADVNVPERHVARLHPGQKVSLTADATGEVIDAAIERIAPEVDPATGTVKVTVAVARDADLSPGAFVRVDIVTDTHPDALVVPRSALVAEGRRWHVYRLGDNDKVEQLEVSLGFESGDRVEIADTLGDQQDLGAGQTIVVVGAAALSDDAQVRVVADEEGTGADAA